MSAVSNHRIAYIGLGSNIDPEINMSRALQALHEHTTVLCESSIWHSAPLGTKGPDFLNAVVKIATVFDAAALKTDVLHKIEDMLGRHRVADKFAPRTIDLDILIYGDQVHEDHIWDYAYLALPLAECNPDLIEPNTNLSIAQIAAKLKRVIQIEQVTIKQK